MVMQTSCKKGMEQMDLRQAFEIIVDKAKGSSLGEKFYQEADPFLIPCTLAEISRRYSFSTVWACFFLRYLQQWFFSFTYLAFSLGRYDWFLLGLCRNFTRLSLGFGVSWNLQLRYLISWEKCIFAAVYLGMVY